VACAVADLRGDRPGAVADLRDDRPRAVAGPVRWWKRKIAVRSDRVGGYRVEPINDKGTRPVQKIPTLFRRDPDDMRRVTRDVHPDCAWVLAGEGIATRKYDGTCVRLDDDGQWWARREVKPGRRTPPGFVPVAHDEVTGKTVGWEPAEQSSFAALVEEVRRNGPVDGSDPDPGTYELIGPKVNGNPEGVDSHRLRRHADAERLPDAPRDFDALTRYLADFDGEGIVWHHPDGRMAKLKRRDFLR
jgi:hypothetical protein